MNNEISIKDLISSIKKKGLLQSIPQLEQIYQFAIEVEKKLAESEAKCVQLAAENVALKQFPEQIVQFIGGLGTSEIGSDTKEKIGLAASRIKAPATDRIVAEAEARGVEKAIAHLEKKFSNIGVQIMNLQWLADSLREGAK
ncbi:TPA: hypothetical protein M2P51_001815 [Klebsiella pneumoniae]|nr:hypothetical protein [Klebsiella pneumoniae]HDK6205885.1 hypothetical protein [Klebsiella pneumoniae]